MLAQFISFTKKKIKKKREESQQVISQSLPTFHEDL